MNLPLNNETFVIEYLKAQRDAYLAMVDNIERILKITPRTAELRRAEKERILALQLEIKESEKDTNTKNIICEECNKPANHFLITETKPYKGWCCYHWIMKGMPPADWHPECMKVYLEKKQESEKV